MERRITWLGIALVAAAEASILADVAWLSRWGTPLAWWGFILVLDGLLAARRGSSPLVGRPLRLLAWTTASVAFWLIFEAFNLHLRNWRYLDLPQPPAERLAGYLASFATILPGIFLTAEALTEGRAFDRLDAVGGRRRLPLASWTRWPAILCGAACLCLPLIVSSRLARFGFGLVWLGFFLFLDPLNGFWGRPSLWEDWRRGLWGRTLRLLAAGWLCGILWETWNWGAATKWVYTVPVFPGLSFFEIPVAGFLGFGPFALEVFALWHTAAGTWDVLCGRSPARRGPHFETL